MNEEAKNLWKSPAGGSLLGKMLSGEALSEQDKQTLTELKQADPPKLTEQSPPKKG